HLYIFISEIVINDCSHRSPIIRHDTDCRHIFKRRNMRNPICNPISNLLMDFSLSGNKNPHSTPPTRKTYVTACQLVALALFTILICKAPAFPTPVTPCESVFVLIPGLHGNVFHSFVFHNVPPVLENVG